MPRISNSKSTSPVQSTNENTTNKLQNSNLIIRLIKNFFNLFRKSKQGTALKDTVAKRSFTDILKFSEKKGQTSMHGTNTASIDNINVALIKSSHRIEDEPSFSLEEKQDKNLETMAEHLDGIVNIISRGFKSLAEFNLNKESLKQIIEDKEQVIFLDTMIGIDDKMSHLDMEDLTLLAELVPERDTQYFKKAIPKQIAKCYYDMCVSSTVKTFIANGLFDEKNTTLEAFKNTFEFNKSGYLSAELKNKINDMRTQFPHMKPFSNGSIINNELNKLFKQGKIEIKNKQDRELSGEKLAVQEQQIEQEEGLTKEDLAALEQMGQIEQEGELILEWLTAKEEIEKQLR